MSITLENSTVRVGVWYEELSRNRYYVEESRFVCRPGAERSSPVFSPVLRGFWISVMIRPPRKMVMEPVDSLTVTAMASVTAVIAAAA